MSNYKKNKLLSDLNQQVDEYFNPETDPIPPLYNEKAKLENMDGIELMEHFRDDDDSGDAVLKCPFEMQLAQSSELLEKMSAKCLPDAELFTLTDMYLHEITIFGIVKLLDSNSGFSKNIPSSSQPTFKERI